ncbi:MAG: hypothetical protein ACXWLH_05060 [Candidatus Saccharimonadales bacterium]
MEDLKYLINKNKPEKPYLTFLAAQEKGIVDLSKLSPRELTQPLGLIVASGHMPAVDEAGLVQLGKETYAVDHTYVTRADDKEIHLGPANKEDVTSDGRIVESGLLVMTRVSDGLQIYFGRAVTGNTAPWLSPGQKLGNIAINLFGINSMRVAEPKVVDEEIVVAKLWTP